MRSTYSPDADALAVWLDTGTSVGTQQLAPGIFVDRDRAGLIVGIEVLGASTQIDRAFLEALPRPGRGS
jgi:uncharacterized protein YuzE